MIRQNLHTHSTFVDGKDTLEEMVETAIEKGFTCLGFSEHAYLPQDDVCISPESTEEYIRQVNELKQKYEGRIDIFLGLEQDICFRDPHPQVYDFIIGSGHYLEKDGQYLSVDDTAQITKKMVHEWYHDDFLSYAKAYYSQLKQMADWEEVDIIAHLDLLMKFNEDQSFLSFTDEEYLKLAADCIDALSHKIFEVNTGAISRGYRKSPYPHRALLEYMNKKGVQICLNSDCHNRPDLDCYYGEALELIRSCGYTSMMALTKEGFKEVSIDQFQ